MRRLIAWWRRQQRKAELLDLISFAGAQMALAIAYGDKIRHKRLSRVISQAERELDGLNAGAKNPGEGEMSNGG